MRLTELAHNYLTTQLKPGDRAIDATAGNGYDTEHMSSLVGPSGHIIAIDIQKAAVDATRKHLETRKCLKQVHLLVGEHSKILKSLCPRYAGKISAIIFNLGYLPGSDKRIRTTPETTLHALENSKPLLKPNGLLLVTAYRGHEGGKIEADSVANWMQQVKNGNWSIDRHDPVVKENNSPPSFFAAHKLS